MGEVVSTIPSGQTSIRPYWRCYFPNTQAIIYVVDSSDTDRIGIAKEEFHAILEGPGAGTSSDLPPAGEETRPSG
ncbi:hypothetical protein PVK06_009419 [Gossypium arboreum]|uniref:Uncharacterized protein n=1 Tax=Gossypium arboreum TaxID=29729 RepID=A0ABR0QNT6_GOSAR|nr:hypothetical protein PVK06_009419 [Gossypium arboreum]